MGAREGGRAPRLGQGDELSARARTAQPSGIQPSTGSTAVRQAVARQRGGPRRLHQAEDRVEPVAARLVDQRLAQRRADREREAARRCRRSRARRRSQRARRGDRAGRDSCTSAARSARARAGADSLEGHAPRIAGVQAGDRHAARHQPRHALVVHEADRDVAGLQGARRQHRRGEVAGAVRQAVRRPAACCPRRRSRPARPSASGSARARRR